MKTATIVDGYKKAATEVAVLDSFASLRTFQTGRQIDITAREEERRPALWALAVGGRGSVRKFMMNRAADIDSAFALASKHTRADIKSGTFCESAAPDKPDFDHA